MANQNKWKRWFLLLFSIGCLLGVTFWWRDQPTSFLEFQRHDPGYFLELAKSCEQIRSRAKTGVSRNQIAGNDASLPPIIHNLHPKLVVYDADFLGIVVDDRNPGWGVTWTRSVHDPKIWELSATKETVTKVLFATNDLVLKER